MTPELRELRYFLAVAEELNYTRAAARLHIAPQALSAAILGLEAGLGARLFERTTRKVELTGVGKALLPEARATLRRAEATVAAVRRAASGEQGAVRIAFLSSTAGYVMPPVVRAWAERHPGVELRVEDLAIAEIVAGVADGRLDAAVARPPLGGDEGLRTERLFSEPVAAVLPEGHRLAGRESVRLSDLAEEPWVLTERSSWAPWHNLYDEEFRRAGFEPNIVQRGTTVQSLLALVAAGAGVTRLALSARTLRDTGVVFVPLEDDYVDVVLLTRLDRPPAVERFAEVLRELAATTDLTARG